MVMKKFLSMISLMLVALMVIAVPAVSAEEAIEWEKPEDINVHYATNVSGTAPIIDGTINEGEYGAPIRIEAPRATSNSSWGAEWENGEVDESLASDYMDVYFAYDDSNIYIAIYDMGPEYVDDGDEFAINNVAFRSNYRFELGFDLENVTNYFMWEGFRTHQQWPTLNYFDGGKQVSSKFTYDLASECMVQKINAETGETVAIGDLFAENGNANYYGSRWAVAMEFRLDKATVIEMWNDHFNTEYNELSNAMWIGFTTNGYKAEGAYELNEDGSIKENEDGTLVENYEPLYSQYFKWLGQNDITGKQADYEAYGLGPASTRDSFFDLVVFGEEGSDVVVANPFPEEEEEDTDPAGDETDPAGNETAPVTTEAPNTEAPTTETPAEEKKGCNESVSVAGLALVAALGTCTVLVAKKKED